MKYILMITFALTVSACSMKNVYLEVTRFNYIPQSTEIKSVYIMPSQEQQKNTEHKTYVEYVTGKLIAQGYNVVPSRNRADFIALLGYKIGANKKLTTIGPSADYTEGGKAFHGVVQSSYTQYDRDLYFAMYEAEFDNKGKPVQVYKGVVRSSGSRQTFASVSKCLIDALFDKFTESGAQKITADGECIQ